MSKSGVLAVLLVLALLALGPTGTFASNASSLGERGAATGSSGSGGAVSLAAAASGSVPLSSQNFACQGAAINTPRANITTMSTPFGITIDYANKAVYVADQTPDVVQEINGSTETMMSNSSSVGYNLKALAYDTANHQVMVLSQGNLGDILPSVFSLTTGQGLNLKKTAVPVEMAYDTYNGNLYVTDYGIGQVTVIDPSDMTVYGYVSVGSHPWGISVDPYNGYVFVANSASNTVSVISGTKVLGTLSSNGTEPMGVLFDPMDQMLYVTNSASDSLAIINASGNTFSNFKGLRTVFPGFNEPEEMGLDCTHNVLWVANDGNNALYTFLACPGTVYAFSSVQFLHAFNSQAQPQELTYDNYTHAMYVTDYGASNVQVIATDNIMEPYTAGYGCPQGIADYGFNGQQRYSYSTPEVETVTTFSSPFTIGASSNPSYNSLASDQLNVMDYGVAGGIPNVIYWTQDVFSLNQTAKCPNTCFQITDEIFNETTPDAALNTHNGFATLCVKNGGKPVKDVDTFYCNSPWMTGLTFPLTLKLMEVTGTEISGKYKGDSYVSFQYWLSDGPNPNKWIQWDRIDFNADLSGHHVNGDPHFFVSGDPMTTPPYSKTQRCGTGSDGKYSCPLMNDFENVLGGWAGGANVAFTALGAKMQLLYNKSGSLTFAPHALSAGADTGEDAINAYSLGNSAQFAGIVNGSSTEGADDGIQLY